MSCTILTPFAQRCQSFPVKSQAYYNPMPCQTFLGQCSIINSLRTEIICQKMGQGTSSSNTVSRGGGNNTHKKVLIISGYTCIGKTFFCNNSALQKKLQLGQVVDLDSSKFSRSDFPRNYLEAIRRTAEQPEVHIILVSTYRDVATELYKEGYYVAQVFPSTDCKSEWLRRLENREEGGKASRVYKLVDENWDHWFKEMGSRELSDSKIVSSTDYLSTVIEEIHGAFDAQRGGCGAQGAALSG